MTLIFNTGCSLEDYPTFLKNVVHVLSNFSDGEKWEGLLVGGGCVIGLQVGRELCNHVVGVTRRLRHDERGHAFSDRGSSLQDHSKVSHVR